jgi:predicted DNA-binding transcriptional regulator YafY
MRAARLLHILLVLQRRGRSTARELAGVFEVSERTILRDVEALGQAGVPIYTLRGSGGGIELVDGFQTHLTGLTTDEALCLFLAGQPQVAHRMGLGSPALTVRSKLLNALPPVLAEQADQLSTWFLHDPDSWTGNRIPHGELRRLVRSIHLRRRVEVSIALDPPISVRPLGLVLKAGSWHLICAGHDGVDVLCIDELRATRLTNRSFAALNGFDLTEFWALHGSTGH